MTVLGVLVEPDRAVIWCDTETYRDDRPIGDAAKMGLNTLGLAVVGTGSMALIREAARAVQASDSIDKLERRLPAELRIRAAKLAPQLLQDDLCWCTGQVIFCIGYSIAASRMVGWRMDGPGFFEPSLVSRACQPIDAGLEADLRQLDSMAKIIVFARRQIAVLRLRGLPATGGSLVVAEITPTAIHVARIPDFDVAPPLPALSSAPAPGLEASD